MSADRLRQAANVLDHYGTSTPGDGTTVITEPDLYRLAQGSAAVLRAVAARHVSDSDGERCYGCREPWPCPEAAAAEALADVILGGGSE